MSCALIVYLYSFVESSRELSLTVFVDIRQVVTVIVEFY